jgi:outer membrane protein assembly factor BamB
LQFALAAFAVASVLTERSCQAADWPQFLGPTANGISTETGLLDKWPTNGPPLIWEKVVGTGYSAPSVRGNLLVLHHRFRDDEIVEAFDADTGKNRWRYAYPSSFQDPYGYNNGPRCAPVLSSNSCYTFGAEGKLLCLELATGKKVWERDTAKDWNVPDAFFGVGSTPILEGELLIVMVGGQPNSGVVAFDARTGKTVWESVGQKSWQGQPMIGWPGERQVNWATWWKQASYATPVAATIQNKRHVLCLMRQGLVSLDPKTGEVNFSRWFQSQLNDSVNAMDPVVVDDLVFFSAAYYRVGSVLLRVKANGKSFEEVWRSPREMRETDPKTGALVPPVLELHWMTPIYHDGYLYAFSGRNEPDAHFRCVELKTGKLMWDRDESWPGHPPPSLKAQPKVYGRGSAILADGKLIVLGEGGLLGLFKVNPKQAEEISRWQVPELYFPCWAAPILANKRLYLRSGQHGACRLVCLNLTK